MKSYIDAQSHICQMLANLCSYIKQQSSQGYYDVNVACENLAACILNTLYDYNLENYNSKTHKASASGIDLVDYERKICVQVSSTTRKKKLTHTCKMFNDNAEIRGFKLLFYAIAEKADNLYDFNDSESGFNGITDVIDHCRILEKIKDDTTGKGQLLDKRIARWFGEDYTESSKFFKYIDDEVEKNYPLPENYIQRTVSCEYTDNSLAEYILHSNRYEHHTLFEFVSGEVMECQGKYWLLSAAGQTGKSIEARKLAHDLMKSDKVLFPLFYEAKHFKKTDITFIPNHWRTDHIVLILDAYDEIQGDKLRSEFIEQVRTLQRRYPELRIVLTSRLNFINKNKHFEDFERLSLNSLNFNEVKNVVHKSGVRNPLNLIKQIEDKELYSLVYNPFYLKALIDYYKEHDGNIPKKRSEIYRFLIDRSYVADDKRKPGDILSAKERGENLLKQIALIMQLTEKNEVESTVLMTEAGFKPEDMELCKEYQIFHAAKDDTYCFEDNAFELYYVAEFLMKSTRTTDEILDLVTYRKNGENRVRPSWFDSFKIVLADMDYEDLRRQELLDWLFENDPESLLYTDENTLDDEDCHRLFTTILQMYKKEGMSSSPRQNLNFDRRLAAFCKSKESIQFLINEISEQGEPTAYLYLLTFVYSYISSNTVKINKMESSFKEVVYEKLLANAAYDGKWFSAKFFPFYNDIFATKNDLHRMIGYVSTINHPVFVSKIFSLIKKADLCDDFIDFAIKNEKNVHDYYDKISHASCSVNRDSVWYVLTHVSTYDAVKKMWLFLPAYAEHRHGYETEELDKLRDSLLETTSTLIVEHPDLEKLVDQAWQKEYKDCYFSLDRYGNRMFSAYRKCMTHYGIRSVDDFVEDFISLIGKSTNHTDFDILRAGIYLRVTVQDVNRFAEEWDADDEKKCCVIANLKHTPLEDINAVAKFWTKNKFIKAIEPYDDAPSAEEIERHNVCEFLTHERFKEIIAALSKDLEGKDMKDAKKKARDLDCNNNYIFQYLLYFYSYQSKIFDVKQLRDSLNDNIYYYCHVVRTFGKNTKITFTNEQKLVLKTAAETLLRDKRIDRTSLTKCLNLIRIQGFKFDFELVEQFIDTYDHEIVNTSYSFLDYAMDVYGFDKVGATVEKVLNGSWENIDESSLLALIEFAVKLNIRGCYQSVCEKIIHMKEESTYVYYLMQYDGEGSLPYLKANFDDYDLSTQIHIVQCACGLSMKNKKWAESKLLKLKDCYDESEYNQALLILLYLGNEEALNWCVKMVEKDPDKVCESDSSPSLGYEDIKYLPQLLSLLKVVWKFHEDPSNRWYERVQDALKNMAEKNIEQHDMVVNELEQLRDSDKSFASLNFFIHYIKTNHNPRTKSEGFTVRNAYKFIMSNP